MAKEYDLVIAGAGPAGLMVSRVTSESGLKVLLVEQKKDIPKVFRACCSNLIIEPGTHKETVRFSDGELVFDNNRFSVPYNGSVIPLKNNTRISPGGQTLTIKGAGPEGNVAVSFEKESFLQELFCLVQETDVEILSQTQAVKAENVEDGVLVTLHDSGGEFTVKAKVAVAADGVNSRIVQSLDLNQKQRKFFGRFAVASCHMEGVNCPYPNEWLTFVGKGHTRHGRGQLYMCSKPYGGRTEPTVYELTCGVPVMEQSSDITPKDELDYFTTKGRFAPWFKNMKVVEKRAAILNFYTPLINPVEGNVVVVGDAAAFIETYIQGAVMYGFQAANAIVKYLSTGTGLEDYATSWKDSFEYNDPEQIKLAIQVFGIHVMTDDDLDYLFGLTGEDDIRGYLNEFTEQITIMNAIFSHLDQVEKERPELAAALQKLRDVSVQDALQIESDKK